MNDRYLYPPHADYIQGKSMSGQSLSTKTFFGILFIVMLIAIISVPIIADQILKIQITLQTDFTVHRAIELSSFIQERYQNNIPLEEIQKELQTLVETMQNRNGFIYIVNQNTLTFISNPVLSLVGTLVSKYYNTIGNRILFSSKTGTIQQIGWEQLFNGKDKKGTLKYLDQDGTIKKGRLEAITAFTLKPFGWIVFVDDNISNRYAELMNVQFYLIFIITAIGIAIAIAFLASSVARRVLMTYESVIEKKNELLASEINKSDSLLLNILPKEIAKELKEHHSISPRRYDEVTVLFADLVGFSDITNQVGAETVVSYLNTIFNKFDEITMRYNAEKIKIVGDEYMIAAGVPRASDTHVKQIADIALEMRSAVRLLDQLGDIHFDMRIGIHTGPVVAGIIGKTKFVYDLWGNTVNMASRMESTGRVGKIQVSETVYSILKKAGYTFEERDFIKIRGKGEIRTYFLEEPSEQFYLDT